ncbi:MAG TPA: hypothetical protein VFV72_12370 [Candidatus Limnocylindrales bacterium]|nr:hypothetical protein [Candidatus Limnocylindrales bacterium]
MPPRRCSSFRLLAVACWVGLALLVAACAASFDPSGPCTTDGRAAGAYPDLEALVPRDLAGMPATQVDSGRNCSEKALGSLKSHGVDELRFAGAVWETGPNGGVSSAVLEAPNLRADWVHEFYKTGAEAGRNTEQVTFESNAVDGTMFYRMNTLNGESYQTVVDWQDGDRVRVVIVASFIRQTSVGQHDRIVEDVIRSAMAANGN